MNVINQNLSTLMVKNWSMHYLLVKRSSGKSSMEALKSQYIDIVSFGLISAAFASTKTSKENTKQ